MKAMFMMIVFISLISGFIVLSSLRSHLLLTLIGIEFLMIVIFLIMYFNFIIFGVELYFLMIFLIMLVCEGSLGLSMLVSMIRSHGSDMVNSLYMVLW
uniref:NADH dehydrogenase subunit 4L n=1 Tax=Neoplerochila paliatseasi TaxID=2704509 RepID=UPI0013E95CDB|nr:NADH dehydrogenase subunit 4L [Neoplerochila paliatseasi]QHR79418.1 NADH dehydrogenase subunit 4L [Neoplerochila paliatseasi]